MPAKKPVKPTAADSGVNPDAYCLKGVCSNCKTDAYVILSKQELLPLIGTIRQSMRKIKRGRNSKPLERAPPAPEIQEAFPFGNS